MHSSGSSRSRNWQAMVRERNCQGANCPNPIKQITDTYCSEACRIAAHQQRRANRSQEKGESPADSHTEVELHRRQRTHWFEKQVALDVLRYRFQQGKKTIRIATGFFTIRGYNLLRHAARQKQLFLLVGLDEPGE